VIETNTASKHQAFARAYRPQNFDEVVGQEHVLQALTYSLDQQNLHHAYLLTGTRGVGKTTLGRLFAKALNCEKGISSSPCGVCSPCMSIASSRFVDLIEVDGASNTKVEDTRELLEDVQFVPTQGRFKIYLIDEVHMLSTHSFNALLKTLEEPPEHVKFILATTDPQKLPITVLSRCLQFHLQLLSIPLIQQHIELILKKEAIPFEDQALYLLAEAAQGSMRDALTLTDQARSQGQGQVLTTAVTSMLGILDQQLAHQLLRSLLAEPVKVSLDLFNHIQSTGADANQVLKDLLELCHHVALAQALGEQDIQALIVDPSLRDCVLELAQISSPTQLQLCFETLLQARKTLSFASSPGTAARMAILRISCFQSINTDQVNLGIATQANAANSEEKKNLKASEALELDHQNTPMKSNILPSVQLKKTEKPASKPSLTVHNVNVVDPNTLVDPQNWFEFVKRHSPGGMFGQLLYNSCITQMQQKPEHWVAHLVVSSKVFSYDPVQTANQVASLLSTALKLKILIEIEQQSELNQSPALLRTEENIRLEAEFELRLQQSQFIKRLNEKATVSFEIVEI